MLARKLTFSILGCSTRPCVARTLKLFMLLTALNGAVGTWLKSVTGGKTDQFDRVCVNVCVAVWCLQLQYS